MINELLKENAEIAKKSRHLKKLQRIQNTSRVKKRTGASWIWVTNCKILIKLNATPEEAKVLVVRRK